MLVFFSERQRPFSKQGPPQLLPPTRRPIPSWQPQVNSRTQFFPLDPHQGIIGKIEGTSTTAMVVPFHLLIKSTCFRCTATSTASRQETLRQLSPWWAKILVTANKNQALPFVDKPRLYFWNQRIPLVFWGHHCPDHIQAASWLSRGYNELHPSQIQYFKAAESATLSPSSPRLMESMYPEVITWFTG